MSTLGTVHGLKAPVAGLQQGAWGLLTAWSATGHTAKEDD